MHVCVRVKVSICSFAYFSKKKFMRSCVKATNYRIESRCEGINPPDPVTGIAGAVCLCSLVTLLKLLGSEIYSPVSSFPVMMGSLRCAKKHSGWGALLTLTQ